MTIFRLLLLLPQYKIACFDSEYDAYAYFVVGFSALYIVGVPALFAYLLHRFAARGRAGDKTVQRALSWMYEPFVPGKEYWMVCELFRVLVLSSFIGFMAQPVHQLFRGALFHIGAESGAAQTRTGPSAP